MGNIFYKLHICTLAIHPHPPPPMMEILINLTTSESSRVFVTVSVCKLDTSRLSRFQDAVTD